MAAMNKIKILLDEEFKLRNCETELCDERPDPLLVARNFRDEYVCLACALFAYGKASLIVKFLKSINFDILHENESEIIQYFSNKYYRFQNSDDITEFFLAIKRIKSINSLNDIFVNGYRVEHNVLDGLVSCIGEFQKISNFNSHGGSFLIGNAPKKNINGDFETKGVSAHKRWNMFFRWMVRDDFIDLGLWANIDKKDLILPLDIHTFEISKKLGLLNRNTYDLESAILITKQLRQFDPLDPIKYDFALYRIGQERILNF
jgi:uncharacterized protein (TIGR02757 family)